MEVLITTNKAEGDSRQIAAVAFEKPTMTYPGRQSYLVCPGSG